MTVVANQGAAELPVECFDTEQFSGGEILGLFHTEVGVWLATREGAYRWIDGRFAVQFEGETRAVLDVGKGQVLIGTSRGLWKWTESAEGVEPVLRDVSVNTLTLKDRDAVWVGGDPGLFLVDWNRPSSSLEDVLAGEEGAEEAVLSVHPMPEVTEATFSSREPIYEGLELLVGTNQGVWGIYKEGDAQRLMRYPLGKSVVDVVSNGQETFAILQRSPISNAPVSLLVPETDRSEAEGYQFFEQDAFGKEIGLALELVKRPGTEIPEIWFGREEGLYVYGGGLDSQALLLKENVYSILSFDGRVFVGTEEGLWEGRLRGDPNALGGTLAYLEEMGEPSSFFRPVHGKGTDFSVYEVIESDGNVWFRSGRRACGYQTGDRDPRKGRVREGGAFFGLLIVGLVAIILFVALRFRKRLFIDGGG